MRLKNPGPLGLLGVLYLSLPDKEFEGTVVPCSETVLSYLLLNKSPRNDLLDVGLGVMVRPAASVVNL